MEDLRGHVRKPLRPKWVTQANFTPEPLRERDYHVVICCTASRQEENAYWTDGYIQGAGDDSECWSQGLAPADFWKHSALLISASCDQNDILQVLADIRNKESELAPADKATAINLAGRSLPIFVGRLGCSCDIDVDAVVSCDDRTPELRSPSDKTERRPLLLQLDSRTGKLGSRTLRDQLPQLRPFMEKLALSAPLPRMLFVCSTGRDLSIGVALTVLCLYFDENGR